MPNFLQYRNFIHITYTGVTKLIYSNSLSAVQMVEVKICKMITFSNFVNWSESLNPRTYIVCTSQRIDYKNIENEITN